MEKIDLAVKIVDFLIDLALFLSALGYRHEPAGIVLALLFIGNHVVKERA